MIFETKFKGGSLIRGILILVLTRDDEPKKHTCSQVSACHTFVTVYHSIPIPCLTKASTGRPSTDTSGQTQSLWGFNRKQQPLTRIDVKCPNKTHLLVHLQKWTAYLGMLRVWCCSLEEMSMCPVPLNGEKGKDRGQDSTWHLYSKWDAVFPTVQQSICQQRRWPLTGNHFPMSPVCNQPSLSRTSAVFAGSFK